MRIERRLENFGAQIDVLRPEERANPGPLVTQLNLAPPAVDLAAHHCRFIDKQRATRQEREQRTIRSSDGRKKLPSGEYADASSRSGFDRHLVILGFDALPAEAPIHRGQQLLGRRRFRQRQQFCLIQPALRALCFRIEFANRFNFVTEELNAHGAIEFRRIDVEDSAAARELTRHFDEIDLGVTYAGQMRGEHLDVDLFAALEGYGQAGIVLEVEELESRGFDGSDENIDGSARKLPQRGGALLLDVGMRGEIFERKHIVGGKPDNAGWIDGAGQLASGFEERLKGFGGLVVGHDQDDRLFGGPRHQRQVESPRRRGQSGHTPPSRTQAKVPANALKARGMLQLREYFADKREDHEALV